LFELVGLSPEYLHRYPSELSGGHLQRARLALAMAVEPRPLVRDDPRSSLDASTQAQVLNPLAALAQRLAITSCFTAHAISVVRHLHTSGPLPAAAPLADHSASLRTVQPPGNE